MNDSTFQDYIMSKLDEIHSAKMGKVEPTHVTIEELSKAIDKEKRNTLNDLFCQGKINVGDTLNGKYHSISQMGKFEQTTAYYGAYYLGALIAAKKIIEAYPPKAKGDDGIYTKAELELITRDKANMQKFLEGCHRIGFRNHIRNAKGKLMSCEAYWIEEYQSDKKSKNT